MFEIVCDKVLGLLPCVSTWKTIGGPIIPMNLELLYTIHSLQSSETLKRHFGSSSDKLQKLGPLSLVKRPQSSPKPLNLNQKKNNFIYLFELQINVTYF